MSRVKRLIEEVDDRWLQCQILGEACLEEVDDTNMGQFHAGYAYDLGLDVEDALRVGLTVLGHLGEQARSRCEDGELALIRQADGVLSLLLAQQETERLRKAVREMPLIVIPGEKDAESEGWTPLSEWSSCGDFYGIRATVGIDLTPGEVDRISGCLGYALREVLAGEDLGEPDYDRRHRTITWGYDSTKSQRDDPNFEAAFERAMHYVTHGTPVRKTNRAGAGTQGTRLVEGVGQMSQEFFVR